MFGLAAALRAGGTSPGPGTHHTTLAAAAALHLDLGTWNISRGDQTTRRRRRRRRRTIRRAPALTALPSSLLALALALALPPRHTSGPALFPPAFVSCARGAN